MNLIRVEPTTLELTASKMEGKNQEYQSIYYQMIDAVNQSENFWQGKDRNAYVTQIKELESELVKLHLLINDYCAFLRKSARAYRLTQDDITQASKRVKF